MASLMVQRNYQIFLNLLSNSNRLPIALIHERCKILTGNTSKCTQEQINAFLAHRIGQELLKNVDSRTKKSLLQSSDIWDTTTIWKVLVQFGDERGTAYQAENGAYFPLKDLRNIMAHMEPKSLKQEEYDTYVASYLLALTEFKRVRSDLEETVNKLMEIARIKTSAEASELANRFIQEAKGFTKQKDFAAAIDCLDYVITVPHLSEVYISFAYEQRAECYLVNGDVKSAQENAITALKLNKISWNAHFLLAQCYRQEIKISLAIIHLHKAVAISPGQKHIRNELETCKSLAKLYGQDYNDSIVFEKQLVQGQDNVLHGHLFLHGLNTVKRDEEKAFICYHKAANVGNSEGTYCLGFCYAEGKGVNKDIPKAYEYYSKAADMPSDTPGVLTPLQKNVGVASAQYELGLMFETGTLMGKDISKAVKRYSEAAINGCGRAANKLGDIYYKGIGVLRNKELAEKYWKQAIELKESKGACSLMTLYMENLEPDKAKEMLKVGKEMGDSGLKGIKDDEFVRASLKAGKKRSAYDRALLKADAVGHGEDNKLSIIENVKVTAISNCSECDKLCQRNSKITCSNLVELRWEGKYNNGSIIISVDLAKYGSQVCHDMLLAINSHAQLAELTTGEADLFDIDRKHQILYLFYEITVLTVKYPYIRIIPTYLVEKLKKILFPSDFQTVFLVLQDGSKYFDTEYLTKMIGFCYITWLDPLALDPRDDFKLETIKHSIRVESCFENSYDKYLLLFHYFLKRGDFQSALRYIDEGITNATNAGISQLFYLTHWKAIISRRLLSADEAIRAQLDFLGTAPEDHPCFPEACYAVASLCKPIDIEMISHYYNLGLQAEKKTLPFFRFYRNKGSKKHVKRVLMHCQKNINALLKSTEELHNNKL